MYEVDVITQAKKLKPREEYLLYRSLLTEQPLSGTLPIVTPGGAGTGKQGMALNFAHVSLVKASHMTPPKYNRMGIHNPAMRTAPQRGKMKYLADVNIIYHREPRCFVYHRLLSAHYCAWYIIELSKW